MRCGRWPEMLIDRLTDELTEEDSILLEQHLTTCHRCREDERRLRRLVEPRERDEWRPDRLWEERMRARMASMLQAEKRAPDSRRSQREPGDRRAQGGTRPRESRSILTFLPALLRRSLPTYAAAALALITAAGGLWAGRALPPRSSSAWPGDVRSVPGRTTTSPEQATPKAALPAPATSLASKGGSRPSGPDSSLADASATGLIVVEPELRTGGSPRFIAVWSDATRPDTSSRAN